MCARMSAVLMLTLMHGVDSICLILIILQGEHHEAKASIKLLWNRIESDEYS